MSAPALMVHAEQWLPVWLAGDVDLDDQTLRLCVAALLEFHEQRKAAFDEMVDIIAALPVEQVQS